MADKDGGVAERKSTPPAEKYDALEAGAEVPDPDEDDLDDLDDMLDEFSNVKLEGKKPEPPHATDSQGAASAANPAGTFPGTESLLSDDDFAKQLQAGMADLLGEIENSSEIKAEFENIFKEIDKVAAGEDYNPNPPSGAGVRTETAAPGTGAPAPDASFQETIRRTMERMQASGEQATAAVAAEESEDFLAELLKQMQAGGLDGEGNEEEFSKMLLGMMEQLTNKDILYEPMKELDQNFPGWLDKNRDTVSKEDLARYEEQRTLAREIVAKFEEPTYADSNPTDREYILDRMQKMQAAGQPPADLVGDMPSAHEALNAPDEACNPQ
ncbi:hypothetical protein VTK73DRAFT_8047 [Phialemonium thermophilum]|uniref:Uncharacterized protein n=1 Tax=Phialemonium thermophilum TaxID=223376 RepID=A0ABR3WAV7_9PEZI